ncbi:MAG: thiamine pyrophosphate-binding protein [Methylococcales bacterium]
MENYKSSSRVLPMQGKGKHPEVRIHDYADLILDYLARVGVKSVFGIPGGAIQPFYDALARSEARNGIRAIVARHEAGSSFMADGYTRESGIIGVCCATTGPGATNLITGVASAYENEIPQLIITAQTALSTFGKGAFQESSCTGLNIVGMFQHCTRYNSLISHPAQLEQKLIAALMTAYRFPRGPVHLSIPMDILSTPFKGRKLEIDLKPLLKSESLVDHHALPELLAEIEKARKIVIVVGAGCSGVATTVLELANLLNAKIVTSADGKGLISAFHPLYRGVFGFAGHESARDVLRDLDVDLVLAIGTNFSEWASGGWDEKALMNDRLVHVDAVEKHFDYSPMAKMHVIGSIESICLWLIERLNKANPKQTAEKTIASQNSVVTYLNSQLTNESRISPNCTHLESEKYTSENIPIKPQRLMRELGSRFPPATRFLADTGNSCAWSIHYLHPMDRRMLNRRNVQREDFLKSGRRTSVRNVAETSTYRVCVDFASMGWAIGAAVGTALANPKCPVVCITGDGSYLMNGQEITVALMEKLTVIYVILNDEALGMVKHGQSLANAEQIAYQLPKVDYQKMAEAMGISAFTIESPADFAGLDIEAICHRNGPTLLDVHIDPAEVPPIGMRIKLLDAARKLRKGVLNERNKGSTGTNTQQNMGRGS